MAAQAEEVMQLKAEDLDEDSEEEEEGEGEEDENNEEEEGEGEEEPETNQVKEQSTFTYRCVICDEKFESDSDFHKHRINHDRCPQCQQIFLCHKELIIHLSLHAVEGNICLFCRKISNTKESFDAHLKAHRQHFKTLDCQVCGMKFLTSEEFKIHICRKRTPEELAVAAPRGDKRATVTSAGSGKNDSPAKRIKVEGADDSGNRLADCSDVKIENLEDEAAGGDLKIKQEPDADKPFKCGYCAEPYATSNELCTHMTKAHPDKLS
ncbi:hypothetical protein LOTGIDRAFT_234296 [Lottia gigantea]|uniref:C2H2-type domain-containing protein n=1 Tax=Lottia gigantea TaxID=225164 RepID=V4A851_LOTGI|nr:hypothetical protein LOTGIDRAFT_234296 [Lottia gigantea]ESO89451.1 hypothetical protein LOTGIDRAFT_234296 [Lottia gigantea]